MVAFAHGADSGQMRQAIRWDLLFYISYVMYLYGGDGDDGGGGCLRPYNRCNLCKFIIIIMVMMMMMEQAIINTWTKPISTILTFFPQETCRGGD